MLCVETSETGFSITSKHKDLHLSLKNQGSKIQSEGADSFFLLL